MPEKVSLDDPRLVPLLKAVSEVDRVSLGFTPLMKTGSVSLERTGGGIYDAMLHIYDATSRTIAFKKTRNGYKWIHEQEIHVGPKTYKTVDGTLNEQITITYETANVSGAPLNQVFVQYQGEDSRLANRSDLTLNYVRSFIEEWDALKRKHNSGPSVAVE